MPIEVGARVRVTATGLEGRVTGLTETEATVLIAYQTGTVEVAETHALEALTEIP